MPPKRKLTPVFKRTNGSVHGWPYQVYDDGRGILGTAGSGAFARWSFRLTSFENNDDYEACSLASCET